jgi:hypothetical protein
MLASKLGLLEHETLAPPNKAGANRDDREKTAFAGSLFPIAVGDDRGSPTDSRSGHRFAPEDPLVFRSFAANL